MPKKTKSEEEHLKTIEFLLAGILLKRNTDVQKVAKIIGCTTGVLTDMFPEKRNRGGKGVKRYSE